MTPTLPEGLGPLISLRPQRDFAANLSQSIPKPNSIKAEVHRSKEEVFSPQQVESNQAEERSKDLGQTAPTPFGLKPLNKLSETDVARIRDVETPEKPRSVLFEEDRLALRKQVVRPESINQFSKPDNRNFLDEEPNKILQQNDTQDRQVITAANALQARDLPPPVKTIQSKIEPPPPNIPQASVPSIETIPLQEPLTVKREAPLPLPEKPEPRSEETPPAPESNKQPQDSELSPQTNLPNPAVQERVRSAYGLPSLSQPTAPKTQDLFDRLSTISIKA